ncbi:alpha/beta-hydrolase [Hypoxylon sp. FL0543]|nr:alpha/beta-hydrolase [Hypoxylon sp. FL0543]
MAAETYITTPDGVRLRYWQEGPAGAPNLVFLAGWVQTAAQFVKQVEHFKKNYRVTTYDHRGHGDSDKPAYGYRMYRLAADLEALLAQLDLQDVTLVGHSMGASVTWAHWDVFPHDRIAKLVFVDQARTLTFNPAWTEQEKADAGAVFSPEVLFDTVNALRGPQGKEIWTATARQFFTPGVDPKVFEWALQNSMKSPPEVAAAMMLDHASMDWGDVFPRITVPVLVVGAKCSLMPPAAMEWIVKQVPNSRLVTFEKEERGSHFMFIENPDKFNRMLEDFLAE